MSFVVARCPRLYYCKLDASCSQWDAVQREIRSVSNVRVVLALLLSALLLTFVFPAAESQRVVRIGERVLENNERIAAGVIGGLVS